MMANPVQGYGSDPSDLWHCPGWRRKLSKLLTAPNNGYKEIIIKKWSPNKSCYDDKEERVSKKDNEKLLFREVLNPFSQWFSYDPYSWEFPKCVGIPWDETRCCPPNVSTTTHAPTSFPETYPAPNILEWLSYLEYIKEGSPRLTDNPCRYLNNTLQAQMLSGTLAVTLREVVVVCFLRKRFWLYRQKKNQKKVTLTAAEWSPGLLSCAVLESFLGCFCNNNEHYILMGGGRVSPCVASEVKHKINHHYFAFMGIYNKWRLAFIHKWEIYA